MFWVYENWVKNKARIHLGICGHCNEAREQDKVKEAGLHCTWHGHFNSYERALKKARRTGARASALHVSDTSGFIFSRYFSIRATYFSTHL